MTRSTLLTAGILAAVVIPGTALAASEHASPNVSKAYLAINPVTCRFAMHEVDAKPSAQEAYAIAEDARDDVLQRCLRDRKPIRVTASGTGQSITATCPTSYRVTGGGAESEVQASYPADRFSWTVTRDKRSPQTVTVDAVCTPVS